MNSPCPIERSGRYFRVIAPNWINPADTTYAKQRGGRWNPPGEFGALYLNAIIQVAAANARVQHAGRAIKLFDLLPAARPALVTFTIPSVHVLDACTDKGLSALELAPNFPYRVPWLPCQTIARAAHAAGLAGVAARSAAEVTATTFVGEELALFEGVNIGAPQERRMFQEWYPDPIPGSP